MHESQVYHDAAFISCHDSSDVVELINRSPDFPATCTPSRASIATPLGFSTIVLARSDKRRASLSRNVPVRVAVFLTDINNLIGISSEKIDYIDGFLYKHDLMRRDRVDKNPENRILTIRRHHKYSSFAIFLFPIFLAGEKILPTKHSSQCEGSLFVKRAQKLSPCIRQKTLLFPLAKPPPACAE